MKIVSYANCQGAAAVDYLKYIDCDATHIDNYRVIFGNEPIVRDRCIAAIKNSDIFIYQPIDNKYAEFSTEALLKHLKPRCVAISFPYIYSDCFDLYEWAGKIIGGDAINEMKCKHVPISKVKEMIKKGKIDFNVLNRWQNSLQILEEKELACDIKVSSIMRENKEKQKLFRTQNHPENILIYPILDAVCSIINGVVSLAGKQSLCGGLDWKPSPGEAVALNYTWAPGGEPGWDRMRMNCVDMIYNNSIPPIAEVLR